MSDVWRRVRRTWHVVPAGHGDETVGAELPQPGADAPRLKAPAATSAAAAIRFQAAPLAMRAPPNE